MEQWFLRSPDGVLIAISAYGMGVDKADIAAVLHLELPYSPEAYLQEAGRAGRDGRAVQATLLYGGEDLAFAGTLADPAERARHEQVCRYALGRDSCRRALVRPEGERQILEFVGRQRRRFTPREAAYALRGERCYPTVRGRLEGLREFGTLAGWRLEDIETALQELERMGRIRLPARGPWKGRRTRAGRQSRQERVRRPATPRSPAGKGSGCCRSRCSC